MSKKTYGNRLSSMCAKFREANFVESYSTQGKEAVEVKFYQTKRSGTYGHQFAAIVFFEHSAIMAYGWTGGCGFNKPAAALEGAIWEYIQENDIPDGHLMRGAVSLAGSGSFSTAVGQLAISLGATAEEAADVLHISG